MAMPVGDRIPVMYKDNTAAAMALRATCGRINKLITHARDGFFLETSRQWSALSKR